MQQYRFPEQVQQALEALQHPLAIYQFVDRRVVTLVLSDGFLELFGYTDRAQAYYDMDRDMYKDTHPDDRARIADEALRFATKGGQYEVLYRTFHHVERDYRVIHALGRHVFMEDGTRLAHVWYTDEGKYVDRPDENGTDLSRVINTVLHDQSIFKASSYDYLTGLPSMTYFFELAEAGRQALAQEGKETLFLFFDMTGMKFYNKTHGFAQGDQLIKSFAGLLADTFSNENCCRISGDHFAVYAPEEGAEDVLNGLFRRWSRMNDGHELTVRVGIYSSRMEDVPVSTACDRAKIACDAIRNNYVSRFNYYDQGLRDDVEQRQYILSHLDQALEERWIQVHYQPIVRAVNGRVCDEEALARWYDPERGFLSPADFIPYLEDAGLIFKLDLYVLERTLEKIKVLQENGLHMVPQSVNLSRSDFDDRDIVEEIRRRVDEAGVSRALITLEITESAIGGDFEFIKGQIERFQALGFPVWMDDFGSGYSSLDVLQSVKFNLIKFDMSFMKRLDQGNTGKVILTDLMRMATSLGVDTVCEGVETQEQVRFLQAIGCSKLQGFYFLRAIPMEQILERYNQGIQIGFENPLESGYYDAMGRINLYDLSFLANKDELGNTFDTLPMGIIEAHPSGKSVRYVRTNESYRDFIHRCFGFDLSDPTQEYPAPETGMGSAFMRRINQSQTDGDRMFVEESMEDGSVVHTFIRRIGVNPVTNRIAFAVAVLSVTSPGDGATYAGIARALAADYYRLFYVDVVSEDFIEYSSPVGGEEIAMERHGRDFFSTARQDVRTILYEPDQEAFLKRFTKENILRELGEQGSFIATYRQIDTGKPLYMRMKIMRMDPEANHIIIGVSIIDAQLRQQEEETRLRQESTALRRIAALSGSYMALYMVDLATERFVEFNANEEYSRFGFAKQGEHFFAQAAQDAHAVIAPEDLQRHLQVMAKEHLLSRIRAQGILTHRYRLRMEDRFVPMCLRAALVEEEDGEKLLIGVYKD